MSAFWSFLKYNKGLGDHHPVHPTVWQKSHAELQEVDHSKLLGIKNKIFHLLHS